MAEDTLDSYEFTGRTIRRLLTWYEKAKRDLPWRQDRDPYHVWISEIMLQQTRVAAVIDYYNRFMSELPDISHLAGVEDERLMKLWEGLGYYNRARNLKKAAGLIMEEYGGRFPDEYEKILALPGIGAYTAGAIASVCFDAPTPAVDGNVLRVYTRLTGDDSCIDLDLTKRRIRENMLPLYETCKKKERGTLTQSWMELGATVCLPNGTPLCSVCPLRTECRALREDRTCELPVRAGKKARKIEERTVFLLCTGDHVAMHRRPETGLLADLWEFPNILGRLTMQEAVEQAEKWGLQPSAPRMEFPYTHIFSHVEWRMTAYYLQCEAMPEHIEEIGGIKWFHRDQPEEAAAVPSAFRPFLNLLKSSEEKL